MIPFKVIAADVSLGSDNDTPNIIMGATDCLSRDVRPIDSASKCRLLIIIIVIIMAFIKEDSTRTSLSFTWPSTRKYVPVKSNIRHGEQEGRQRKRENRIRLHFALVYRIMQIIIRKSKTRKNKETEKEKKNEMR